MASVDRAAGTALAGGQDGAGSAPRSGGDQGPVAAPALGGTATGPWPTPWPTWAHSQLTDAVRLARTTGDRSSVAALLYREWFNPAVGPVSRLRTRRPLAGSYRAAHAGSGRRVRADGVSVVQRHDVIGADGWWRTWGEAWTPPRSRPGSVRLLLTPRVDRIEEFVTTVTSRLVGASVPWSLACAAAPRRLTRIGGAVLDVPDLTAVPPRLIEDIAALVHPVTPPLCLPLTAGVGLAEYPTNGMTFGEHRCHLIALGLRHPGADRDPLTVIASVFAAHGLDPSAPHRSSGRDAPTSHR